MKTRKIGGGSHCKRERNKIECCKKSNVFICFIDNNIKFRFVGDFVLLLFLLICCCRNAETILATTTTKTQKSNSQMTKTTRPTLDETKLLSMFVISFRLYRNAMRIAMYLMAYVTHFFPNQV